MSRSQPTRPKPRPTRLSILLISLFLGLFTACGAESQDPQTADAVAVDGQSDASGADAGACGLPAAGTVTLPADDGVHDELVEWWYWTGHLTDEKGRHYGFQVTFFLFGDAAFRAQLANVAIVDIETKQHHSAAKFQFGKATKITDGFEFALGAQTAKGGGGHDVVHAEMDTYTLDLKIDTTRRAVLQHTNGYQAYDFGGYTYYYSRPRMQAKGTLKVGGETRQVSGSSWFDHQWGDLELATELGWDWFAINLDDGRDIMAFVVHAKGGDLMVGGSVTGSDCVTRELKPGEFKVKSLGQWISPESKCRWNIGWEVSVDGAKLALNPVIAAQEVFNPKTPEQSYWEGASTVTGDVKGLAYVELAGCVTGS
ncbi:MAG: carotenoid 1,2-hydratase [Myxococcales bacterium]|nr:carotenoid 1,2-hydratase [Myxococcales bacterium]